MKIEELKQGQAVWVKGFVDSSVFGGCGGFIDFYNQDGNHCGHISRNNVREMKEEDIQLDQPKLKIPQFMLDWVDDSREHGYEFDEWFYYSNQPLEVYKWLNCKNKRQADINALALMTLIVNGPDAVTVEKEKVYQIIDKRLNATFSCLGYDIEGRAWFWGNKKFFKKNKGDRLAHTRQQLIDAGYEEVFENPNYEAEEVKNDL
ncbi:DUF1642 domain-containing protein [Streptococcus uberis]|uniref:DUF1642 domain-containing protein n=1 Tax=Streptococcus uberis TaxID=1349 RepID=UPI001FF491D1|nr:DUF1642 domain-containing protein [Streptococcus uberis]MCK1198558.1 DUF1642 domain-containing protein [Streptococcus uberis]MCK1219587.1 DUF1642 domain-containing protein [Streptococcus uberis]